MDPELSLPMLWCRYKKCEKESNLMIDQKGNSFRDRLKIIYKILKLSSLSQHKKHAWKISVLLRMMYTST